MRDKIYLASFLIATASLAGGTFNCQNMAHPHFLSVSHREGKGIGYKHGYSSVDLFLSHTTEEHLTPFLDLRAHYFDDRKYAANAGFGLRDINNALQIVIGINGFYDFRQVKHGNFQQAGAGLEVLGRWWDFRANGYFPVFDNKKLLSSKLELINDQEIFTRKFIYDFIGGDIALGRILFKRAGCQLRAAGGAYYLHGRFEKQVIGGFVRFTGQLTSFLTFEAQGSYDHLFKWIGQGQLSLVLPFGRRLKDLKQCGCPKSRFHVQERLIEPVSRFEIIPIAKRNKKTALLTDDAN